jgi:hypothetical protein
MGAFSDVPSLTAAGTILPRRAVRASSGTGYSRFSGSQVTAATDFVIGVSDGSVKNFSSVNHAEAGDSITLQGGSIIEVTTGSISAISCGSLLKVDTNGKFVVGGGANDINWAVALEPSAAADVIIRAQILKTPRIST